MNMSETCVGAKLHHVPVVFTMEIDTGSETAKATETGAAALHDLCKNSTKANVTRLHTTDMNFPCV